MGTNFSQAITEAKERDSHEFSIDGIKIKGKEAPTYLKKVVQELPELQVIDIKGKLKACPSNVNILTHLEILRLSDNKLSSIPQEIAQCTKLLEVDLANNQFQRLPPELSSVVQLSNLNLSNNQLSTFPQASFDSLEILNLTKNEFSDFPGSICSLTNLRVLNFNENKIVSVPVGVGSLVNLREFHLRGNQIKVIPPTISKLQELTHLDISENQIREFPPEMTQLRSLAIVEAQHNMISSFPAVLCSIPTLSTLKLHDNEIEIIPPSISNLSSLSELYLQENKIKSIPEEIGKVVNLRKLYLEYNQLSSLPEVLSELKKIVVLILHHNKLTSLPECIREMTSLLRLSLDDNPLDAKTLAIIQKDGALSLVNRDIASVTEDSKKFMSLKRRSMRGGNLRSTLDPGSSTPPAVRSIKISQSTVLPDLSGLSDTKGKKKSKDAETGVPSYSKFKFAFDSLLEEQDFSKKKKEMLKKMSDSEKWQLLNQYKGSTLELLRNQSKPQNKMSRRVGGQKGAKDFVQSLKDNRVNKNTMNRMKTNLQDKKSGWSSKFVEAGGIIALTQYLQTISSKSKLSARDASIIKDCLDIFKILLDVSLKSVLTASGATAAIALPLSLDFDGNKWYSVELLEEICVKEVHIGAQLVMDAITTVSKNAGEEIPFIYLVHCLESEDAPVETKAYCLSLINQLVDSIESLESRFKIRTEFMRMGFQSILDQLRVDQNTSPIINREREIFEEETKNDYEDMRCHFQRTSIIKKISPSGDGTLSIVVVTDSMQTNFSVEITTNTSVGDIKQKVVNEFKISKPEEYGIYSPPDAATEKDEGWLNDKDNFAECGLTPEQMAQIEFRMIPWKLTVLLPNGKKKRISVDPNLTCEQVLARILKGSKLPKADYCIMLRDTVLQEAKTLERSITSEQNDRSKLVLTERPLRVRVILGEDAWQMMNFDPKTEVSEVFTKIGNHVGRTFSTENFDLVIDSPEHPDPISLELGHTIQEYVNSDGCRLRFISKEQVEVEDDEENDCNIWLEPADCNDNITFEKNKEHAIQNIETATFNKLVERVTSMAEYDLDFVNVFIMMYKAFTTDEKLWQKLLERFRVPDTIDAMDKQKIQMRVCVFIKNWIEKAGPEMAEKLRSEIKNFLKTEVVGSLSNLALAIVDKIDNPKAIEERIMTEKPPDPIIPRSIKGDKLTLANVSEKEVARQLTLETFSIYKQIKTTEFFKAAWSKDKYKHLAPNILKMIDHYNAISTGFASVIVSIKDIRSRAKMFQRVITIANELRLLNNYHLVSAIVSGINNCAIGRLKFTHARISKSHRQILQELESVVSMEGSFKNFREALAAAGPPAIPFMGAYLTDLVFIADGNPDKIGNRINFVKHKFVYNVVARIQTYQNEIYALAEVLSIKKILENIPKYNEAELYKLSLEIEPRGATLADIQAIGN